MSGPVLVFRKRRTRAGVHRKVAVAAAAVQSRVTRAEYERLRRTVPPKLIRLLGQMTQSELETAEVVLAAFVRSGIAS